MKVTAIASALALCALTSPALAKPLHARDVRTKTVTETETDIRYKTSTLVKYKTITETEIESIVKTKTKTLTETETEIRKKTITETSTTTKVRTQTVPVTTTNVITRTSVSTRPVTIQAPASTVTLEPITTTLTQKGSTSVSTTTLTQKGSAVTTYLPASTVSVPTTKQVTVTSKLVSTVVVPSTQLVSTTYTTSLPPQTVTITTKIPGLASTVSVYDTITSWMTSACSSNGTFPTTSASSAPLSMPSNATVSTTSNATVSLPSNATMTSSTPAATSTQATTYVNVVTERCSDPKAYYLQVDGTGQAIDGTVVVVEPSDNNPGNVWLKPFQSSEEYTRSPFTFDSSTGWLRAYSTEYEDYVLGAYNDSSAEFRGAVFAEPADYSYGDNIVCTSSSNGDGTYALTCGTTMDGSYHDMDKLVDFQGARWWAFLDGYDFEDYTTYDASFTLVPACDL